MADAPTREEILDLLRARLATILARPFDEIGAADTFVTDLEADSLDLVEAIEGVEGDLVARGATVNLSEEELLGLRTVGETADRLHAHVGGDPA